MLGFLIYIYVSIMSTVQFFKTVYYTIIAVFEQVQYSPSQRQCEYCSTRVAKLSY